MMTCFFVNCVFENDIFLLFLRIRNNCDNMFFSLIAYLKMTYLGMFYYIVFVYPSIEIIRITTPFNEIFIFVFPNNFFYNIYFGSIFSFLQFPFIENTFYYLIIQIFNFISYYT